MRKTRIERDIGKYFDIGVGTCELLSVILLYIQDNRALHTRFNFFYIIFQKKQRDD